MKKIKKLTAIVFAVVLVIAMAVPAFAANPTPALGTSYDAYQIFSGTQEEQDNNTPAAGNKLGNIEWGSGIDTTKTINNKTFVDALKAETTAFVDPTDSSTTNVFANCSTAEDVAKALSKFSTDSSAAKKFSEIANNYLSTTKTAWSATQEFAAGLWLFVDTTTYASTDTDKARNLSLLQFTTAGTIDIRKKNDIPTVDKQVQDEADDKESGADANGWGETADHAINEVYQYKLTAQLPNNDYMKEYIAYTVNFKDHFNAGVTFLGNIKVEIYKADGTKAGEVSKKTSTAPGYEVTGTTNAGSWDPSATGVAQAGDANWSLKIKDILDCGVANLTSADLKGLKVVVTYDAKLNENAHVTAPPTSTNTDDTQDTTGANVNDVELEYSNNSNWTYDSNGEKKPSDETGKTEKDYVWTFTYEIPSIKTDENSNALEGAGFKLYREIDDPDNAGKTIKEFAKMDANNKITGWTTTEAQGTQILSTKPAGGTDARFDIFGLDTGVYYLKETSTPSGYNTCADVKVTIDATHAEDADKNSATTTMTMKKDSDTTAIEQINVVNQSGVTLPETGALGTKMIYIVGAIVMLGAAVVLISRRRVAR